MSRRLIKKWSTEHLDVERLEFSPASDWIASANWLHDKVQIWTVPDGTLQSTLNVNGRVMTMDLSPDGKTIAVAGDRVEVWTNE